MTDFVAGDAGRRVRCPSLEESKRKTEQHLSRIAHHYQKAIGSEHSLEYDENKLFNV